MVTAAWQYGVLGIAVLVFGWVIYHLFNRYEKREQILTSERKEIHEAARNAAHSHAIEREAMRTQHEASLRTLAEGYARALRDDREALQEREDGYAKALRDDREATQEREDQIRREFSELMESVAAESSKMASELTGVLNKIYDRFLARNRPR
jgi:DNA anti-recombination protein RmuC